MSTRFHVPVERNSVEDCGWWKLLMDCREKCGNNPKSIIDLVVDLNGHFKRFFFYLKSSIDGFMIGCMTFLALDRAHISSHYKGVLLDINANNNFFSIVFGLVELECTTS